MGILVAAALLLVAAGTVIFHFWSPWWWTELASNWVYMDTTIIVTFWITGVVFVAVIGFTAYCVFKFRHREGNKADYEPENHRLEIWLTALTTLGVAGMLTPGLFVWNDFVKPPEGAAEFEVVGSQWSWQYRLPGADGELGYADNALIGETNPFGIDPNDPAGQDDVLVEDSEIHMPVGRPVKALLRSIDVLHNFYVPQFRAKMDLVPGTVTYYWFEPTRTGSFDIMCFELCGSSHYAMRGTFVVDEPADYEEWVSGHPTFAELTEELLSRYGAEDVELSRFDPKDETRTPKITAPRIATAQIDAAR